MEKQFVADLMDGQSPWLPGPSKVETIGLPKYWKYALLLLYFWIKLMTLLVV